MNAEKSSKKSVEERRIDFHTQYKLGQCRELYPDTTLTTITSETEGFFTDEVALGLSQKVCGMTASGLLCYRVVGKMLFVYKSREFLEVAKSFKKGVRVRCHDPKSHYINYVACLMEDGIHYRDGFAMVNLRDCIDSIDWGDVMAIYIRPIEEDGK